MKSSNVKQLAYAAVVAALYAALCYALAPISYGAIQFRIAEALTLLPLFLPCAVPGLFIGCILANFASPYFLLDVVIGSCATLLAAFLTRQIGLHIKNERLSLVLAPLPPILCNTFLVGGMLTYTLAGTTDAIPFALCAWQIFVGEAVVCYVLGIPLMLILKRTLKKLDPTLG